MTKKNSEKIVRNYFRDNLTLFNDKIFREVVINKDFATELLKLYII